MSENVISDECLASIRRACYEAGKNGREAFTVRGADGPEIVRCRDCVHFRQENQNAQTSPRCNGVFTFVNPNHDGFCAWGRRADE